MSLLPLATVALLFLAGSGVTEEHNSTVADEEWCGVDKTTCALHDDDGPWAVALQQWALNTSEQPGRVGRIMALPPTQGYYVSDRIDGPMLAPPPPPHPAGPPPTYGQHPTQPSRPPAPPGGRPPAPPGGRPYDEWQRTPPPPPNTGKIVNRPPNPYKDKFKPSYPAPVQNQPIPVHGSGVYGVDRVDENRQPPQKQVSETDLYLLGAIEKLVYRADLMEKRLRKMEEAVHYLVAGVDTKPEPCAENFTRMGAGCYHVSSEAVNWKGASYGCRRLKSSMLEIDSEQERKTMTSSLINDKKFKGGDFWTGGLNPGLLWIWSHSARPVVSNSTGAGGASPIAGQGRCLGWAHEPATNTYVYRGEDCALRHRYICEKEEDKAKLSNEIERVARQMRHGRKPKIIWTDDEP